MSSSSTYLPRNDPRGISQRLNDTLDDFMWGASSYFVEHNDTGSFEADKYQTDYFADEACNAIEAYKDSPFFMYLAFWAPHIPLLALKEDYDRLPAHITDHTERVYGAMVVALDRAVGTVLKKLESSGLLNNTLVIFTSDNGGAGYLNIEGMNKPYRGSKLTFFEGGIRVPLFMQWPLQIPAGKTVNKMVSLVDLWPTVVSAATFPSRRLSGGQSYTNERIDGKDLLPYITAPEATCSESNGVVTCDAGGKDDSIASDIYDIHSVLFWRSGHYKCIRVKNWKLQVSSKPEKLWLFNLMEDEFEHNNLADSLEHSQILQQMLDELKREESLHADPLWPVVLFVTTYIDGTTNKTSSSDYVVWPN